MPHIHRTWFTETRGYNCYVYFVTKHASLMVYRGGRYTGIEIRILSKNISEGCAVFSTD